MGLLLSLMGLITVGTIEDVKTKQRAKEAIAEIKPKIQDYNNPKVNWHLQRQYYITYSTGKYVYVKNDNGVYTVKEFLNLKRDKDGNFLYDKNGKLLTYSTTERLEMARRDFQERGYTWQEEAIPKTMKDWYGH